MKTKRKNRHNFVGEELCEMYTCSKCGLRINKEIMVGGVPKNVKWTGSRFPKDWVCDGI